MLPNYPTFDQAHEGAQNILAFAAKAAGSSAALAVKGVYAVEGFGLSLYPGEPTNVAVPGDVHALLAAHFPAAKANVNLGAIPWVTLLPMLWNLLQMLLPLLQPTPAPAP